MRTDLQKTAIILNDQLGRGRSSTTAVIVLLIQRWLKRGRESTTAPKTPLRGTSRPGLNRRQTVSAPKTSWQVINSCLRVIRSGLDVKAVSNSLSQVADTRSLTMPSMRPQPISTCAMPSRIYGSRPKNRRIQPRRKHWSNEVGPLCLLERSSRQRYIICSDTTTCCSSRLTSTTVHLMRKTHIHSNPSSSIGPVCCDFVCRESLCSVFKTLEKDLLKGGLESLTPIERIDPADGMAVSTGKRSSSIDSWCSYPTRYLRRSQVEAVLSSLHRLSVNRSYQYVSLTIRS